MHPYPQLMTIMTTIIIKNEDTDEKQCWAVLRKLGGCVFTLNGTQLVFLQVPGFKELQAFLHCQAFLQTLGPDVSELPADTGSVFLQEVRIAFRFHYIIS